jgi:hypothetical protein
MAEFVKYPGGPGTWTAAATKGGSDTLTLTLGERADLFLVGGGPNREKLSIAFDGVLDAKAVGELPWDEPDRRLVSVTPAAAGTGRPVARLPNGGPPYTRTVEVVVVPRKASSVGPENVLVFAKSYQEAGNELGGLYRKAVRDPNGAEVVVVQSRAEFVTFLTRFRDTGRRIASLSVFSHGSPGTVYMGDDGFGEASARALRGKGYETVFAPGARVFFSGCNVAESGTDPGLGAFFGACRVAEGGAGVRFLKAVGQTFLFHGGGSVGASTSVGLSIGRGLGNGKMYHLWGETVRLYFDTTGRVVRTEGIGDPTDLAVATK